MKLKLVFEERGNRSTRRKPLGAEQRTNKLNPHMTPDLGIEPGPHWWEAIALTTAPSLKSKEYYTLLVSTKAQLPNHAANLKRDFNFSENQLIQAYSLPHTVTFEPYLRAFQYKVSNSILYTNAKLFKIGFIEDDKCTFCKQEVETIYHLMFHCFYSKQF